MIKHFLIGLGVFVLDMAALVADAIARSSWSTHF